jgi:hypothetical protein
VHFVGETFVAKSSSGVPGELFGIEKTVAGLRGQQT